MRNNLGDLVRKILGFIDGIFINSFGEKLKFEGKEKRGYYELPTYNQVQYFGIDEPDEMEVVLSYKDGENVKIGNHFFDVLGGMWIVDMTSIKSSLYKGKSRIILGARRYQETFTTNG